MAVMDAGVHLPLIDFGGGGFSYSRLAETVDAARACGFRAISANDHFLYSAPWLDGLTALAAVVERSGGMKLVTSVALAALRGPVPLAKALSALDVLSDGRVIAGVGPGSSKADYDAVGMPFEQRWKRFDETLSLIRALLQPATAGGAGDGALAGRLLPPPRQSRGIPLWIGSWGSRAGMRRIARVGDGWLASAYNTTPEAFTAAMEVLGGELESQQRLSRCGRGLPAAGQRPTGFCPRSSPRWSGATRRSSAAGSASAPRASAPSCCPDMPARGASESTSGLWVTSRAR
jgi:alkanesulfonate monooxygenase SsuD/methylene tetrahydromethanopterin reductase-like flavin-dependent oxidoreductase (luciferase family)